MAKKAKKTDEVTDEAIVEEVAIDEGAVDEGAVDEGAVDEGAVDEVEAENNGRKTRIEFMKFVEVWETHSGDAIAVSKILGCSVSGAVAKAHRIRCGASDDANERIPKLTVAKSTRVKPDFAKGRELVARLQRQLAEKSAS